MSIYATLWILKFPGHGYTSSSGEWETVLGQGVLGHIGTPSAGYDYESGDPYASFLPPAIPMSDDEDDLGLRAVVIIRQQTEKIGQEYVEPLVVLSGDDYRAMTFEMLHERICDALSRPRPRVVAEGIHDGEIQILREGDAEKPPKGSDAN